MNTTPNFSINELIENDGLTTVLQPLISMNRKGLLGFEALTRAINPRNGESIPPFTLFNMCEDLETLTRLDRACRRKAFETFAPISRADRSLLLSVNIDAAIINEKTFNYGLTGKMVEECSIPVGNVVLEIIESKAGNDAALSSFVAKSREHGFLIALDDVGTGHSNLDRIPSLKPDIIKIDRSLIADINRKFHNMEVTRSLISLAERTGCLPLAEGIETIEEALTLMSLGIDVFQGYFFSRPAPAAMAVNTDMTPVKHLASRFKTHVLEKINRQKIMENSYKRMASKLREALMDGTPGTMDSALSAFITDNTNIECAYILDTNGIQVSETICNPYKLKENRRLIYQPAPVGADHSLKEYYLTIKTGNQWHTTAPYISLASGNNCVTVSTKMYDTPKSPILCIDIST
ncbi:EAL domain-containing protein [Maridesulfovibrio salexigens]|uniref:Diguanylate phosphodiesterase n=1 Tax=Maridesulfovibrio salexigens (strain ATCC 14822 / DSM 2638 / NCIMB 8403 / VKM B-1763) TaxID=526222 RepID=C6C1E5_MARSD|nr:EAL domain-containing protein [Maridesulfovibrio salexigens]ACS81120.1 diguanylate phosphodiesterase [Maridesulfovibrio salexigens DSM 2638]